MTNDGTVHAGRKTALKEASVASTLFRKPLSLEEATEFFRKNELEMDVDLLNQLGVSTPEYRFAFYNLRVENNKVGNFVSGVLMYQAVASYRVSSDDLWRPGTPRYRKFKINTSRGERK